MKIINPAVTVLATYNGESEMHRHIELCGRVCYKSENNITHESAEAFVKNIIKRGHTSVLEHANLIFGVDYDVYIKTKNNISAIEFYTGIKSYLRITRTKTDFGYIISGNARAFRDYLRACNELQRETVFDALGIIYPTLFADVTPCRSLVDFARQVTHLTNEGMTEPTYSPLEVRTHRCETIRIICDRGVSHELVRHRTASFSQESTRYCNYSADKFDGEITFIKPCFWDSDSREDRTNRDDWKAVMQVCERTYVYLLERGATPQEARAVLPNSLKTEVMMTTNIAGWRHFLELRTAQGAHPQMREVALMVREQLDSRIPGAFDDITAAGMTDG